MNEVLAAYRESVRSDVSYHLNTDPDLKTLVQLAKLSTAEIQGIYNFLEAPQAASPRTPENFLRKFSGTKLDLVLTRAQLLDYREEVEEMRRNQMVLLTSLEAGSEISGLPPSKATTWLGEIEQSIDSQVGIIEGLMEKLRALLSPYFENQAVVWDNFIKECENDKSFDPSVLQTLSDQEVRKIQKIAGGSFTEDMLGDPDLKGDFESVQKAVNKLLKKSKDTSAALRIWNMLKTMKNLGNFNPAMIQKLTQYYQKVQEVQAPSSEGIKSLQTDLSAVKQSLAETKKLVSRTRLYSPPAQVTSPAMAPAAEPAPRPDQTAGG